MIESVPQINRFVDQKGESWCVGGFKGDMVICR